MSIPVLRPNPSRLAQRWITRSRSLAQAPSWKKKMSEETFSASDALIVPKLASLAFWYSCVPILRWPVSVIVVCGLIRPLFERRQRRHRLERRAGRIAGLGHAVEQRRAGVVGGQELVGLLRDRLGEHAGVEAGLASPCRGSRRRAGPSRSRRPRWSGTRSWRSPARAPRRRPSGGRSRASASAAGPAWARSPRSCAARRGSRTRRRSRASSRRRRAGTCRSVSSSPLWPIRVPCSIPL